MGSQGWSLVNLRWFLRCAELRKQCIPSLQVGNKFTRMFSGRDFVVKSAATHSDSHHDGSPVPAARVYNQGCERFTGKSVWQGICLKGCHVMRIQPELVPRVFSPWATFVRKGPPVTLIFEADMYGQQPSRRLAYVGAVLTPAVTMLLCWPLVVVLGDRGL
jgi:hypothetical protein